MSVKRGVTVVHSLPSWLPLTCTWLYGAVTGVDRDITAHVCCETTENAADFPFENIHALPDAPPRRRVVDRLLRRSRLRVCVGDLPHVQRLVRADVLHTHWGDVAWRNVVGWSRPRRVPHVVTFYGKDVNYVPQLPGWSDRYQTLFERVDLILCEGPFMAQSIVDMGCAPDKVRVQHLGVDLSLLEYRPRQRSRGEPLKILMAASFREKKGLPDALEAIARARRAGVAIECTVIGDASADPRSHPEKDRIMATIRENGLEDLVRLMGYQPYSVLQREMYDHHVFLSPSVTASDGDTEGGAPVAIIEAAATGMLVISTTHCDIPEVIVDGETGLLAAERDPQGLAELLLRISDADWSRMLDAGRARVEAEFDSIAQGRRLGDIYRELARS